MIKMTDYSVEASKDYGTRAVLTFEGDLLELVKMIEKFQDRENLRQPFETDDDANERLKAEVWGHPYAKERNSNGFPSIIGYIKAYRAITGQGLKESKEWVEKRWPKSYFGLSG